MQREANMRVLGTAERLCWAAMGPIATIGWNGWSAVVDLTAGSARAGREVVGAPWGVGGRAVGAWRILDRSPVSVRLESCEGKGWVRYEVVEGALVAEAGGGMSWEGRVRMVLSLKA